MFLKSICYLFFILSCFLLNTSCVKDRIQPVVTPPVDSTTIPPIDSTTIPADTSLHLLDYWNFNSSDTNQMLIPSPILGSASITYVAAYYDAVSPGSTINLRISDSAGTGLRMRNPFTSVTFNMPTTGYKKPAFTFSAERSNSGPMSDNVYYTVDGTNFINDSISTASFSLDTTWALYKVDFSAISRVSNNPAFAVKFISQDNNTGTSGNDRYDNVTLEAYKQ